MRSGEWTQSMALSLAVAVEALSLKDEAASTEIIEKFRGIRQDPQQESRKLGVRAHEDFFLLNFDSTGFAVYPISVRVKLICENCRRFTHNWVYREVVIIKSKDTRPGESWWTYRGRIGERLVQTDFGSWEADY